jgi:hypothetical protein
MILPESTDRRNRQQLTVPDVAGLTLMEAALAYAEAGWFVLPTAPGDIKNPGSVVGGKWYELSSRNTDQIRRWWTANPDYGIALHCGRSGAIVFDLDVGDLDTVPGRLAEALRAADVIQLTRRSGDRGHYVFAVPLGESFGNRAGAFATLGEVRGKNGVVIAAPTLHPDGGRYRWTKTGPIVAPPPDALRECLSTAKTIDVEPLTDAAFEDFLRGHNRDDRPRAMKVVLDKFRDDVDAGMSRHYAMVKALGFGYRDAIAGYYPARRLTDELSEAFHAAYETPRPGRRSAPGPDEFICAARYVAAEERDTDPEQLRARKNGFVDVENQGRADRALAPGGLWHPDTLWPRLCADQPAPATSGRYRLVSARELAQPVAPMRWLVRGIWPERSAGVLAGDKKSMKTWNLQAIALAVAAGTALFDKYHVMSPGGVLYLSGEGGRSTFTNRHQVIAARYGITDLLSNLLFGAEFGVGSLRDEEFIEAVKRHLDKLQPKLVILDPLYAYHPHDVEVQNVYDRGQMLANLQALIGDEAALIVGDHFNKTAPGRLDLDNIAQAGMAQWADSWILQKHRETPNLDANKFWLEVETGTRRGGGKHLEVDWTLERDSGDPDVILWTGVDWDARPCVAKATGGQISMTVQRILQVVEDNPLELTLSGVLEKVGGNREKAYDTMLGLKANGGVVVQKGERKEGTRMVKRDLVGLGPMAEQLRLNRFRLGNPLPAAERVEGIRTDDGMGSEQVDQ